MNVGTSVHAHVKKRKKIRVAILRVGTNIIITLFFNILSRYLTTYQYIKKCKYIGRYSTYNIHFL